MYNTLQILQILKSKKEALETKYSVSELALFGSYARGDFNEQSDIDILIDFNASIDGFDYIKIAHELEDAFKYKIDLVSRKGISAKYLPFVEKNLIYVWERNKLTLARYTNFFLSILFSETLFEIIWIMDLQLIFDQENTLELTNEQFKMLVNSGETMADFFSAKDYYFKDDFSRLFLSYDSSLSDFFFEFDPEDDINKFIQNAYLTNFFPKTGKIKLIPNFNQPLGNLLLNNKHQINDIIQIKKERFSSEQKIFTDVLNKNSLDKLLSTGDFKGQITCCECGEKGCSSQYLWANDSIGMISFHILAAKFVSVCLYPFKLV